MSSQTIVFGQMASTAFTVASKIIDPSSSQPMDLCSWHFVFQPCQVLEKDNMRYSLEK